MFSKFIISCAAFVAVLQSKAQTIPVADTSKEIAFASDTQAPMFIETLWLKSNHNKAATKKIFTDIETRKPLSLFLLGDVVSLGFSNKQWKPIKVYLQNLRNDNIPVYATLGNHEVIGRAKKGEEKFKENFPDFNKTGFIEIKDSVAIVLFNSNFSKLSAEENEQQVKWFKKTLQQLDDDPAVQFIITGCHHSPYTNSKIVHPNTEVQQKFVPAFLASKKCKLFLSGHSHNFEHYQVQGKDFFVIGGGGGLHQYLNNASDSLPNLAASYNPLFHYVTIRRNADGLQLTSYELGKDFSSFDKGLTYEVRKTIPVDVANTKSTGKKSSD